MDNKLSIKKYSIPDDAWRARRVAGKLQLVAILAVYFFPGAPAAAQTPAGTLERVKARGHLECGVSQGVPGFSSLDDLDPLECRCRNDAVHAAVGPNLRQSAARPIEYPRG